MPGTNWELDKLYNRRYRYSEKFFPRNALWEIIGDEIKT